MYLVPDRTAVATPTVPLRDPTLQRLLAQWLGREPQLETPAVFSECPAARPYFGLLRVRQAEMQRIWGRFSARVDGRIIFDIPLIAPWTGPLRLVDSDGSVAFGPPKTQPRLSGL